MLSHPLCRTKTRPHQLGWGDWEMGMASFPGTEEGDGNEAREWDYYSRMSTTHTVHNGKLDRMRMISSTILTSRARVF